MKSSGNTALLVLFIIFCGFMTNAFFPKVQSTFEQLFHTVNPPPTPTPLWQEQHMSLTKEEKATMSGSFFQEIQTVIATFAAQQKTTITPTPVSKILGIASGSATASKSAIIDTIPPTVTITGGPNENDIVTGTRICFPLWVSDNVTNYMKLVTRIKINTNPWTEWEQNLSPCVDIQPGSHTFTVQIKDEAGNISPETQRHFVTK